MPLRSNRTFPSSLFSKDNPRNLLIAPPFRAEFCLPSEADKPGLMRRSGHRPDRETIIRIARAPLVTTGSEGRDRTWTVHRENEPDWADDGGEPITGPALTMRGSWSLLKIRPCKRGTPAGERGQDPSSRKRRAPCPPQSSRDPAVEESKKNRPGGRLFYSLAFSGRDCTDNRNNPYR